MISKEMFCQALAHIKEHVERENRINDFMQNISIEFLYSAPMDLCDDVVSLLEEFFPIQASRYLRSGVEDWSSPIAYYVFEHNSTENANIPVRFYNADGNSEIVKINNFEELYDAMIHYETASEGGE